MDNLPTEQKVVFIHTDLPLAHTGFGKNCKAVIEHLYKAGKYKIINFAVGTVDVQMGDTANRTPWKTIPAVNAQNLNNIKQQNDPKNWENIERMAGYGAFELDAAVKREKPDVVISIQDIWGIDFAADKSWFKKIPCALWTTLDSLPILPKAVDLVPKVKHFWSWADFATKALRRIEGCSHVKTVRGSIDHKPFFKLPESKRLELRKRFGIPDKVFVVGYVFRNQLRKSVPNLLQGFKIFKNDNPTLSTKLLLHTSWIEGWDIPKLMQETGLAQEDILTTYVCRSCRFYHIQSFSTNDINCPNCRAEKQFCTTHPSIGVSDADLNEIYNLMDVYCHPFTSGGQEIPIQEAKLTELITLVTNYSCGEDSCVEEAASFPLDWAEYREPGTQFIKASTYPSDIAKQLNKVVSLSPSTKAALGKKARKWVIDNFSIEIIGKFLEEWIDAAPKATDECFNDTIEKREPHLQMPQIEDDGEFLLYMYKHILKMDVDRNNDGFKYWMGQLAKGDKRQEIEKFFRQTALKENVQHQAQQIQFESFLNPNDKGRVLVVQPESAGDILLITALFKSIKTRYPDWALYVSTKPEYRDLILGNPYVDKWLEYNPLMENTVWLEGNSTHNGYFNIAYLPFVGTQRAMNYRHGGCDTTDYQTNMEVAIALT